MDLPVKCSRYNAELTTNGCKTNCDLALDTIQKWLGGVSISSLDKYGLERMIVCGQCKRGPDVDLEKLAQDISSEVNRLVNILECDRHDLEKIMERYKERHKRYRENKRKKGEQE